MEIRLWRELLVPYELAVKELVMKFQQLKKEHKEKDLYCPIEEVSGRVKSITAFWKKCRENRFPGMTWRKRWRILPESGLSASFMRTLKLWRI